MKKIMLLLICLPSIVYANNFSCPYGKQGACLDYNDKVCSSYSKCVSENAQCYKKSACGYGGFVCKSDLESLAGDYDDLASKCKRIANDYNDLLRKHKFFKSCIDYATTIEDVKLCY